MSTESELERQAPALYREKSRTGSSYDDKDIDKDDVVVTTAEVALDESVPEEAFIVKNAEDVAVQVRVSCSASVHPGGSDRRHRLSLRKMTLRPPYSRSGWSSLVSA